MTDSCVVAPTVPVNGGVFSCPDGASGISSFDSNLGTLVAVQVQATLRAQDIRFQFENRAPSICGNPDPNAWSIRTFVRLLGPPALSAQLCPADPLGEELRASGSIPQLAPFDGCVDFGLQPPADPDCLNIPDDCASPQCLVRSGVTINAPDVSRTCPTLCLTDAASLAQFTTNGPGTVDFGLGTSGTIQSEASGCGKGIAAFRIFVSADVTVTYVYCTNTPPTAEPDSDTVCRNTADAPTFVDVPILANDCDDDGSIDCGSILITVPPSNGTTQILGCSGDSPLTGCDQSNNCPGCVVRYTPNANYTGPDAFQYTVADDDGCRSSPATVSISVFANPTANDDGRTTCRNTPITIDVLANDVPVSPSRFFLCSSLTIVGPPTNGGGTATPVGCGGSTAPCASTCRVQFSPSSGFVGLTCFVYEITDSNGCKARARVCIEVCAPTANPDRDLSVCQDDCIDVDLLANDTRDPDCSAIACGTIVIVDPPDHGTAQPIGCTGNAPCAGCRVRYCNNDTGFVGIDTFTYTVRDANGCVSAPAQVSVAIRGSPSLADVKIVLDPGDVDPFVVEVLADVSPGEGCEFDLSTLQIVPGSGPSFGTATVNLDGTITYDPDDATFQDEDVFCVSIANSCDCSDQACVEINVQPVCDEFHRRRCGSLLLYPEFQTRPGQMSVHTITYGCCEDAAPGTWVELIYIREGDCLEQNWTIFLTPCDTFAFLASQHVPSATQGYLYAFAKSASNPGATPIVMNRLIGSTLVFDGMTNLSYSMNAVSFQGHGPEGSLNDEDGDGVRDLDGEIEYDAAPDRILVPRFLGQDMGSRSQLVLIALSGGTAFSFNGGTEVTFAVFDDDEDALSAGHTFYCWKKVRLVDISNAFLQSTIHDPISPTDDPDEIAGLPGRDAGWFTIDGVRASSSVENIVDPAIYAVLIEQRGSYVVADLPFEFCSQANGDLLPNGLAGDPQLGFPGGVIGDDQ